MRYRDRDDDAVIVLPLGSEPHEAPPREDKEPIILPLTASDEPLPDERPPQEHIEVLPL